MLAADLFLPLTAIKMELFFGKENFSLPLTLYFFSFFSFPTSLLFSLSYSRSLSLSLLFFHPLYNILVPPEKYCLKEDVTDLVTEQERWRRDTERREREMSDGEYGQREVRETQEKKMLKNQVPARFPPP